MFSCRLAVGHGGEHAAGGLYDWQSIYWRDGDRRAFTGEFTACDESTCFLPAGHQGRHA